MNEMFAKSTLDLLEKEYQTGIENAMMSVLGVPVDLKFSIVEGHGGLFIMANDAKGIANSQLTATPFLRQMFKSAEMRIDVYRNEGENYIVLSVGVAYQHGFEGGSNGTKLMVVIVNTETGEIEVRK